MVYLCELRDREGYIAWCWLADVEEGQIVWVAETGERPWWVVHCWRWLKGE
jgi:hypothetical protein